jgi:hypothetical protein
MFQAAEKKSLRAELIKTRWHNNVAINAPVPLLETDVDDRLLEKLQGQVEGGGMAIADVALDEALLSQEVTREYYQRFKDYVQQVSATRVLGFKV